MCCAWLITICKIVNIHFSSPSEPQVGHTISKTRAWNPPYLHPHWGRRGPTGSDPVCLVGSSLRLPPPEVAPHLSGPSYRPTQMQLAPPDQLKTERHLGPQTIQIIITLFTCVHQTYLKNTVEDGRLTLWQKEFNGAHVALRGSQH